MTQLATKLNSFFGKKDTKNPAFSFFFETKAREKKRMYTTALKKAQTDQENTLKSARTLEV